MELFTTYYNAPDFNKKVKEFLGKSGRVINGLGRTPFDYGAVGDGVTDDTAAIQEAMNAGGTIFIPWTENGYKVTTLAATNSTYLIGLGLPKIFNEDPSLRLISFNGISKFTLDGLELTQTADIADYVHDGDGYWKTMIGHDASESGETACDRVTIRNCYLHSSGRVTIYNFRAGKYWRVIGNVIEDSSRDGIHMNNDNGGHHIIANNLLIRTGDDGITLAGDNSHSVVHGNVIQDAGQYNIGGCGIRCNSRFSSISNNTIRNANLSGIVISDLDNTPSLAPVGSIVSGNTIFGVKPTDNNTTSLITIKNANDILVTGNTFDAYGDNTLTITGAANNGSGLIRITTSTAHGYTTSNRVRIRDVVGTTEANSIWTITKITDTTFDLQGSTFSNAYVSGGTANNAVMAIRAYGTDAASNNIRFVNNNFKNFEDLVSISDLGLTDMVIRGNHFENYNNGITFGAAVTCGRFDIENNTFKNAVNAAVLRMPSSVSPTIATLFIRNNNIISSGGVPIQFNSKVVTLCRILGNDFGGATAYNNSSGVVDLYYDGDASDTPSVASHTHIISDTTGLQAALDAKLDDSQFSGLSKISVGTSAPASPSVGDVWIDTN